MKKMYLFLALILIGGIARSQQRPIHVSELAKHPKLMTPALAQALSKQGPDEKGYLPPVSMGGYNLTDSTYQYNWDISTNDWALASRSTFINDCQLGKPILRLRDLASNPPGQFNPSIKEQWAYLPNGNTMTHSLSEWDDDPAGWVLVFFDSLYAEYQSVERWNKSWDPFDNIFNYGDRLLYTRDNNGNVLVNVEQAWDTPQQDWIPDFRYSYTYDNGNLLVQLEEDWDEINGQYVPSFKREYTYNASGLMLERLESYYTNGNFLPLQRYTYTYDASGNNTGLLTENYDQNTGQYLPLKRTTTVFDAANHAISWLEESYDNGIWNNFARGEITYHSNGNASTNLNFIWAVDTQDWLQNRSDSILDNGNYLYFDLKDSYDPNIGGFGFGFRLIYDYNAQNLFSHIQFDLLEAGTLDTWDPANLADFEYDADGRTLEYIDRIYDANSLTYLFNYKEHYYNTGCFFVSDTKDLYPGELPCTHANPIRPGQPIHCTGPLGEEGPALLELYSLDGKKVHDQPFSPSDGINLTQPLPNGLYLLLLHGQHGATYRSKVVVME